jgi:hypothetical protein
MAYNLPFINDYRSQQPEADSALPQTEAAKYEVEWLTWMERKTVGPKNFKATLATFRRDFGPQTDWSEDWSVQQGETLLITVALREHILDLSAQENSQ